MANAYGLNSGAVGQAALAMNNQRQNDLKNLIILHIVQERQSVQSNEIIGRELTVRQ